jgi:phenylacetate-CoA ligase
MLAKQLFILAHNIEYPAFYHDYKRLIKNQQKPFQVLKVEQEKELRSMILFCYENVPYYHKIFKKLHLFPSDICVIEDLEKLPILTKDIIKQQWNDFVPANLSTIKFYKRATGGSTGIPLPYRLSKTDRFVGGALLYRGWGYGGYELGDKMAFLAGSSLSISSQFNFYTFIDEFARNLKKLSSFDMGEIEMRKYVKIINSFKPKFIRGYASSTYFFTKWIQENNLDIYSPTAVFTTAEKLYPHMRSQISEVFSCEVYDGYGLNDGGISAYECPEHSGLHIDTERSIMEVIDPEGSQIDRGKGKILATSLHNYAMPFIRYDTGDLCSVLDNECTCGRHSILIDNIIGREKEFLVTRDGKNVHGAALFNLIFDTLANSGNIDIINKIKGFQIVQKRPELIEIVLSCDEFIPDTVLAFIRLKIQQRFAGWDIEFKFVDKIERTAAGKYKFIINQVKN